MLALLTVTQLWLSVYGTHGFSPVVELESGLFETSSRKLFVTVVFFF